MDDHLEQQLVNELRAVLQPINEKYKGFFHINMITLCDMNDMYCADCIIYSSQCKRCVVEFEEVKK